MANNELIRTPLVGKRIKISKVTGGTYLGLGGEVIEDRMNVLVIMTNGKRKMVPKGVCTFQIYHNGELLGEIDGQKLIGRPEKRCN